jgi:hypothetical protein
MGRRNEQENEKQPRQQGELHIENDKYFSRKPFRVLFFDDCVNNFPSEKAKTQSGSEIS